MNYKQLQAALKIAKSQGLTSVKLNAKKDVLQAEYDRINAPDFTPPQPTRREILAKMIAEATDDAIDTIWVQVMSEPETSIDEPAASIDEPAVSDEKVLETIKELDTELGTENYLPIYHLRKALPQVKRTDLDAILYRLQRTDQIDFSTLQETTAYTPEQIDAGIPQNIGGQLFFLIVN